MYHSGGVFGSRGIWQFWVKKELGLVAGAVSRFGSDLRLWALLEANMLLAVTPPKRFTAAIVNQERYRGRRYVTYDVVLGPWGGRPAGGSEVVSPELYYALRKGSVACVDLNRGALGVEYYQIRACSEETRLR
jgi:hypothetical protein